MIERHLRSHSETSYALLRLIAGLMFSFHGMQKVLGVLSQHPPPPLGTQLWFGGVIELVAGLAIALGVFVPWAAFLASGTMAVAYTQFHWRLALGKDFLPAINHGELALLYALVFLCVACRGAGAWSVDGWRRRRGEAS